MEQLINTFKEAIECQAEYVAFLIPVTHDGAYEEEKYGSMVWVVMKKDFKSQMEVFEKGEFKPPIISSCWAYTLSEVEDLLELNKYK